MNININKGFELAKKASEFSDYNKKNIHIGSVIMYKNRILGIGYNTNKTSPIQYKYNYYREKENKGKRTYKVDKHLPCLHSEMMCLINTKDINIDWSKTAIFIYRENCGNLRNCKPCIACEKALKDRGIKTICYTTEDGYCKEDVL